MFEHLANGLQQLAPIPDEGMRSILAALQVKDVRKKSRLLSPGDDGNHMYFVNTGLFRYFVMDKEGNEQTTHLIPQNNWFGDARAFLSGEKTTIYIEAIEDSQIFSISHEMINRFYDDVPYFERAVRKLIEHYFIKVLEKGKSSSYAGYTAQERYLSFLRAHPKLVNRVPAIYLASYLGTTPETLSRIRSQYLRNPSMYESQR